MKFRSIGAMNFRSLRNVQLDLRRSPGLYFMTGHNRDRPALGRNGVGKSSIWQAMRWCLYGSTSDGMRAEALKGMNGVEGYPDGYVSEVQVGKKRLTRTWHPNGMEIDGDTVSSFKDVVPLSDVEFDACVLACQGGSTILDYTPSQRLELVSSVLGLEKWNTYSKAAQDLAARREADITTTACRIGGVRSSIKELKQMDMRRQIEAFEKERHKAIFQLKGKLAVLKGQRDALKRKFKELTAEKEKCERGLKPIEEMLTKLREKATLRASAHDVLVEDLLRAEERLSAKKQLLEHIQKHGPGVSCELCGSKMTVQQRLHRIGVVKKEVEAAQHRRDIAYKNLKEADEKQAREQRLVDDYMKQFDRVKDGIKDLGHEITELLFRIPAVEKDVDEIRQKIQAERNRPNPMKDTNDERLEKLRARRAELHELKEKEEQQERAHGRACWWITGFKDVRYYVLEEALAELTAVTQAHLLALGMHEYGIEYVAEKEAKSGNVSRTFDIVLRNPVARRVLPLQAFSGGEQQRIRLCAAFALSDFLLRRRSLICNLEIYDEPTAHLSQEGIDAVVELLKMRAQQSQKQIWLVDHHAINSTAFADTVVLELKKGSTRIVS